MFYYIEGTVAVLEPAMAVIDCGGVGYALSITAVTAGQLHIGSRARLYVSEQIREDCFDLFGFYSREEKHSFELLTGVSGVGPKAAQAILSVNTPDALTLAIMSGNERALTCAPGIGKKIAQRVILELKDKLGKEAEVFGVTDAPGISSENVSGAKGKIADASAALTVLGFGNSEIAAALKGVDAESLEVQDIVRLALRKINGRGGNG